MPRCTKWPDYAVYPPDFHKRGVCWTYRGIRKARSKAMSLGIGSWIRRYVNWSNADFLIGNPDFLIDRLWLWNGARFIRIIKEPQFYKHPGM